MKPQYNSPGIKFPARHRDTPVKNIISLLDVSMKVKELKHDIVLNIRFDSDKLTDFLRYIVAKSFSENFSQSELNNEGPVNELTVHEKDSTSELWINDEIHLTSRQIEVMERLSKGRNYKEIADELGLKYNTVRNYLQHIYPKLGIGNRSEASIEYLKNRDKNKKISSGE